MKRCLKHTKVWTKFDGLMYSCWQHTFYLNEVTLLSVMVVQLLFK
uniref:Uncharacterized protein n=1 Tax=Nelumbo nucifera TaxID=4432 RepID=A0A822ZYF0_NELNU|nr:TPA_asm: hypothetical protein HUJ06_018332 [Nelumbo nucifera]